MVLFELVIYFGIFLNGATYCRFAISATIFFVASYPADALSSSISISVLAYFKRKLCHSLRGIKPSLTQTKIAFEPLCRHLKILLFKLI